MLPPSQPQEPQRYSTVFSTTIRGVRPGVIRVEVGDSDQWRVGDVATLQIQESLVFRSPLRQGYYEGIEVRTLLSSESLEERKGSQVVTDVNADGVRYITFWVDVSPEDDHEEKLTFNKSLVANASVKQLDI